MDINVLIVIAAIWLLAASISDLKKREVPDWLSFSLIAIALAVKSAQSIIEWSSSPILTSIVGLAVFFILANLFYYGRLFAGGDAKLLIALGAVLPSFALLSNILVIGSAYGLLYSCLLAIFNKKAFLLELKKSSKHFRTLSLLFLFAAFFILIIGLILKFPLLYFFSAIIFIFPFLYLFVNSVEKAALIKKISPNQLTEGDWLFQDAKAKGKMIKVNFEGLSKNQIAFLKKTRQKVYVKYGIPFIPVFLIAFLITIAIGNIFMLFL